MESNLSSGTVLGGRWQIASIIGEGACAQVYKVQPTQSTIGYDIVAKVVPFAKGKSKADKQQERICNTLNYEYVMYNGLLSGFPHRPRTPDKFYGDCKTFNVRYLVMEQLDRDLIGLSKSPREVNSSVIARMGLQILEGLKWIHQKGFLFIDVKPDNFMLKGDTLYFVDFGLVERLVVVKPGQTPPKREFAGTPSFCSLAAHNGEQPSAYDDLEAMGFVLLSLTSGGLLPWSGSKSDSECKQIKQDCDIRKLCADSGVAEVADIILICRNASRTVRPNYDELASFLTRMRDRKAVAVSNSKTPGTVSKGKEKGSSAKRSSEVEAVQPESKARKAASTKRSIAKEIVVIDDDDEQDEYVRAPSPIAVPAKKARSTRAAAAAVTATSSSTTMPMDSSPTPAVAPSYATRTSSRSPAAAANQGNVKGPFSTSAEEASHISPLPAKRTRRTSEPSASEEAVLSGPFSKLSTTTPTSRSTAQQKKQQQRVASEELSENLSNACTLRVVKGLCRGAELSLAPLTAAGRKGRKARGEAAAAVYTVGNGEHCSFPLQQDAYLSESHLEVRVSAEGVFVQDANSTNGTKLNGKKILPATLVKLSDGDVIKAGKTEISVSVHV